MNFDESSIPSLIYFNRMRRMSELDDMFDDHTLESKLKLEQFPWNHPDVLQYDKTYRVYRQRDIPPLLLEAINSCDNPEDVFAYASFSTHCAIMASKSLVSLYLEVKPKKSKEIALQTPPKCHSSPFVIMIPSHIYPSFAKLLVIDINGNAMLWTNIKLAESYSDPCYTRQIPLEYQTYITTVSLLSHNQVAIGTSSGNLILLTISSDQNSTSFSIQSSHKESTLSSIIGNWLPSMVMRIGSTENLKAFHPVLRIFKLPEPLSERIHDRFMVLNDGMLQKWAILPNDTLKLIYNVAPESLIKHYIAKNILGRDSAEDVELNIIDIDKYRVDTVAMLVSYHVPEMNSYTQFAVVILYTTPSNYIPSGNYLDKRDFKMEHIVTLPYSTIMSPKTRKPTIKTSKNGPIAFVTFEDTVIAICINQKVIFETTIGLKPDIDDMFLYSTVCNTSDELIVDEGYSVAFIFTAKGKVLEFKVDNNAIKSEEPEGVLDDTKFLEKRLLQAAIFQDKPNNPLYFPISTTPMRGYIGKAALAATNKIFVGACFFTGPKNDSSFFSSRLTFIKRICDILKKEDLLSQIDKDTRKILVEYAEAAIVTHRIWSQYTDQSSQSEVFPQYKAIIENIILNLSPPQAKPTTRDNQSIMADYLSKYPISATRFLDAFDNVQESLYFTTPMEMQGFRVKANELILSAYHAYREFEIHLEDYNLPDVNKNWTLKWQKLLKSSFEKTYALYSTKIAPADGVTRLETPHTQSITPSVPTTVTFDLRNQLCDLGQELLNTTVSEEDSYCAQDTPVDSPSHQIQGFVIEVFFKTGHKNLAIEMAGKYKNFSALLEITQSEESPEADKLLRKNLCRYGNEFAYYLCKWYCDHSQEDKILKLDTAYYETITEFLQGKTVSIAWIHYMRICDYKSMFDSLKTMLNTEHEPSKRKLLLSHARLAYLAANTEGTDALPLDEVLESYEMTYINTELRLINESEISPDF
ncbi:hypothetical protein CLU79DRAFT_754531 [Phycomyces nitens]|nr:hypothetical protein CLU79DRAFT_754531 [Phycomyces nitens]